MDCICKKKKKKKTFLMIEVCFFPYRHRKSLWVKISGAERVGEAWRAGTRRNWKPGREAFYLGAACQSVLTSHHIYSF